MYYHIYPKKMKKLRAWVASSNSLCLDLRSKLEFKSCHLKSSTNIPLSQLALRQAELPPKRLLFAVIEPLHHQGCSSWLIERGWQIPWVFWEGHFNWKDLAASTQWVNDSNSDSKTWLLFQPSPFLEKNIDMIESSLPKDKLWYDCLDIGCGAGRDIGWLLSRQKKWRASAFDALPGAMVRTETLVRNLDVAPYLDVLAQAKLMPDGRWKLISNAWWKNRKDNPDSDEIDEVAKRLEMAKLECPEKQVLPFHKFYTKLAPKKPSKFDLILNIRFLSRPFLHEAPNLLNVGGYFLISHFVHDHNYDYKHPKQSQRLEINEIRDLYRDTKYMEVVQDLIEESEDGRPMNSILVRKIS